MEDYYSDNPGPTKEKMPDKPMDEHKDEAEQTAMLPKSILMGKKFEVGDEVVLKIDGIFEDEIQVSYASEPKKEETSEMPMKEPDSEMASLYS